MWNTREAPLAAEGKAKRLTNLLLFVGSLKGAARDRVAKEACRTVPPREHGGNTDIKNLSIGTRIYFPVFTKGAGLAMGGLALLTG